MIEHTFALGTWEIHLQTKEERQYMKDKLNNICEYIDTAIDYNNDYLLNNYDNYKIITKIAPCHFPYYDFFINNHLKCLNREYIDIMLIHSDRGEWQPLAKRMAEDNRFKEIGVSNFTFDEIEEFKEITGKYPAYNEIEINPYYTDLNTINYCKKRNIKIISYGILGGKYHAMTNVADFSLPYLIQYACNYANIVIIKPESYRHTNEFVDIITNYVPDKNLKFEILNKDFSLNANNKSIVPMRYEAKDIKRYCLSQETYHIACGNNKLDKIVSIHNLAHKIDITLPVFEMLGDYQVYIRYIYRQNYNNDDVYYYDFLIGDDKNYYIIYIYDDKDRITKINEYNKVELIKIYK